MVAQRDQNRLLLGRRSIAFAPERLGALNESAFFASQAGYLFCGPSGLPVLRPERVPVFATQAGCLFCVPSGVPVFATQAGCLFRPKNCVGH